MYKPIMYAVAGALAVIPAKAQEAQPAPEKTLVERIGHCLDSTGRVDAKHFTSQYLVHTQRGTILNRQFYCGEGDARIDIVEQHGVSPMAMRLPSGSAMRPISPNALAYIVDGDSYRNVAGNVDGDEIKIETPTAAEPSERRVTPSSGRREFDI